MPDSGWLTSWAIDAVNAPKLATLGYAREFRSSFAERLFREPGQGHILNCADVFKAPILVSGPVSDQVQVFDRTIGHLQPMIVFKVAAVASRSFNHVKHQWHVIGVDTIADQLERHADRRIKLENAIDLLRPHDLVCRNFPGKGTRQAEALAFGEKCLTAPQLVLRCLPLGDVAQVAGEGWWPLQRDKGDRQFDGKFAPVGAYRRHLHAPADEPRFSRGQVSGQSLPMFLPKRRRDDGIGQLLSHDVIPAITEGPLRRRIEFDDASLRGRS